MKSSFETAIILVSCFIIQIVGQFKIIDLNNINVTNSNTELRKVNLVQIKPIIQAINNHSTTKLSTKSIQQTSRSFPQIAQTSTQSETSENKFIKLSIVNSAAAVDRPSKRNSGQASIKESKNSTSFGEQVKTSKPLLTSKFGSIVGYAKKSKLRTNSNAKNSVNDTMLMQNLFNSTINTSPTKARRYKYRAFKSRCRCERIWNCARIQISVARCAPDFFMCCL
ncbi:uncharacterized protein LOC128724315 [Anopheles nili]|uniref:uncharacterized protein LOC128724315 n=1 Tax=Anopheles nili TaxID=185578 RepID=UPI00237AE84F|nr:uncharacterized protein LOC128724315 [Anopheles nili]